jgi:hypothetical protein
MKRFLLTLPFVAVLVLVLFPVFTSGGLGFALWNCVPVILAFVVLASALRQRALAGRASAYAFAVVALGLTAWAHLSWLFSQPMGPTASTASIIFVFLPIYSVIAALVISFLAWGIARLTQRREPSNQTMQRTADRPYV